MSRSSDKVIAIGTLLIALAVGGEVRAQGNASDTQAAGPSAADFARLQAEVREQRQLIIQMLQQDQQRYDMVLRLIQGGQGAAPLPTLPGLTGVGEAPATAAAPSTVEAPTHTRTASVARRPGVIEGRISVTGGSLSDVFVYVENVKAGSGRGKTVEIRQQNKQFSPRVAVVQTGTSVVFPNMDAVYHNVFSSSPGNSFDLGSYRAGDKAKTVTLTSPGVVDVFCNMHSRMSASVLVVPSPLYTKVRADGTFRLDNVPPGTRKLVAWSPESRPVQQKVDVSPAGSASVTFALERQSQRAHANKLGQPYGSYRD